MITQAELERLKRQHAEREAQKQAERVAASAAASFSGRAAPADSPLPAQGPPQMTEELKRTLKVDNHFGTGSTLRTMRILRVDNSLVTLKH